MTAVLYGCSPSDWDDNRGGPTKALPVVVAPDVADGVRSVLSSDSPPDEVLRGLCDLLPHLRNQLRRDGVSLSEEGARAMAWLDGVALAMGRFS